MKEKGGEGRISFRERRRGRIDEEDVVLSRFVCDMQTVKPSATQEG